MAEVSETLQYRFEESGLDDLRRDMKKLSGDVEELGDDFSELGGEAEGGTEAAEDAVEDLQRTVARIDFDELGDEAMEAADEVALAASLMEEELEGVQEKLNDISTIGARRQMRRLGQEVENVMLKAQALDAQDVDIDADVDRGFSAGGGGGRSGVRLPGELDEVQEAVSAFGRLPGKVKALGGALAAAAAALGAAGGLAGAATALATQLGDADLRKDLNKLKQRFRTLGKTFVDAFEPIIRDTVIPAGIALAKSLRSSIPELKEFTRNNLPSLIRAIRGLVKGTVLTIKSLGTFNRALAVLTSAFQALSDSVDLFDEEGQFDPEIKGVRKEMIDIMQSFGFGGESVAGFDIPQGQVSSILEKLNAGEISITGQDGIQAAASEDINKLRAELERARIKFKELGVTSRKQFLQSLVDIRKKGVDALSLVQAKTGEVPANLREWVQALTRAESRLQNFKDSLIDLDLPEFSADTGGPVEPPNPPEIVPPSEVSSDPTEGEGGAEFASAPIQDVNDELGRIESLPQLMQGQKARRQISAVVRKVRQLQTEGKLLTQSGFEDFLKGLDLTEGQVEKVIDRLQQARSAVGALKNAAVQSLSRLTSGIGQSLGGSLFADPRRVQRLEQRRRRIQQNLRQAREAGNFEQVRQLSKELDKVNSKLDKTKSLFGRIGQAFKQFGNIAKQVLEQVISKLISAATLSLLLAPFTGGLSSFGGNFTTILSGGMPELAEGGIVTGPTTALIGEGNESEAVMPLSKLESMIQPQTPSVQPAAGAGGANVNVNVQTEARIEGSDLVVGIRRALNEEAAVGGPGTL